MVGEGMDRFWALVGNRGCPAHCWTGLDTEISSVTAWTIQPTIATAIWDWQFGATQPIIAIVIWAH